MTDIKPNEIFKPYERYFVSSLGRVWCTKKARYLSICKSNGYSTVCVAINGNKSKTVGLHRLVALAFIPNPNNHPVINHIDGNRSNNTITNLEWCSHQHNIQHAVDTGLRKQIISLTIKITEMKKSKIIKLEDEVLKSLHKQAIEAGFNNLQNYIEDVLIKKSEETKK